MAPKCGSLPRDAGDLVGLGLIMVSNYYCRKDSTVVTAEGAEIEAVEDFCYLRSHIEQWKL